MIKKTSKLLLCALALLTLLSVGMLCSADLAVADDDIIEFNTRWSVKENLELFKDIKVEVILASGTRVEGYVKKVGNHVVLLSKTDPRDQYDTLINSNSIVAMSVKMRK
jgi:hypothetical protein